MCDQGKSLIVLAASADIEITASVIIGYKNTSDI